MHRHAPACPSRPSTLSLSIRAGLLSLSSLAMLALPMVSHADLTPSQQDLTKLYLASFLRAPELGGLNYWNAQLTAGSSLQSVGGTIFSIPIVLDIYSSTLSDKDFVEAIYQNVFGRKSDQEGLDYWIKELASLRTALIAKGSSNASYEARGQLVMNMINAGLGTVDGTEGKAYIANRLEVANTAANRQLSTALEIPPSKLKDIEACVNEQSATVFFGLGEIASFYHPDYTLGGTVTGLAAGQTLVLKFNCGTTYLATANGAFSFDKRLANAVNYTVSVAQQPSGQTCTVSNGTGSVANGNVSNVAVTCTNPTPPVLKSIPNQNADLNQTYRLNLAAFATATEGDAITYALSGALPAGLSFNPGTGLLSGTPTVSGVFTLSVTATDKDGSSAVRTFTLTIDAPVYPAPPILNVIPAQSGTQNQAFSLSLTSFAVPTDGDVITYALTGALPAGLTFVPSTGILSGTPTASGTFNLTATASDKDGSSTPRTFTLTIAAAATPPALNPIPAQTGTQNQAYSLNLASYATATEGDAITYALTGALPAGLSFVASTGVLSGTPTEVGSFDLTATASDDDGSSTPRSFTLTIAPDTRPSVTLSKLNDAQEGQPANFRVSLSATAGGVVTVTYNTLAPASGTAATGGACGTGSADYASFSSATVDIPAGQTSADFIITTCADSSIEGAESFDVQLAAVSPEANAKLSTTASDLRQTAAILNTTATGKLNDTGIVTCGTPSTAGTQDNSLDCSNVNAATPAQQDGMNGRDYAAQQDTLTKVGGSTPNNGKANGFDFTKIGSNGQPLANQSGTWDPNGSEAAGTKWDCVLDNVTGLLWENKSDDNGLRDKDWTYTWYNSDSATNGGSAGTENGGTCFASGRCDTEKFVADVNVAGLCGHKDWRMPSAKELQGLADLGGRAFRAIDTGYFPGSQLTYWSGSPRAADSNTAWDVYFNDGRGNLNNKSVNYSVRLVRGQ